MAEQEKKKEIAAAMEDEGFPPSLEEHLEGLKLQGEEEEDLDFSEDFEELVKEVRWLAVFRVHTTKPFSHAALFSALRNAWAASKEVTFKVHDPNLFIVQLHCLGDWTRVMDGRPWIFRGAAVVLEEYDGFSNPKSYKLDRIPMWTRIQGLPDGLMKKKEIAEKVARKVGDLVNVVVNDGKINSTTYLRARVELVLNKPLVRVVSITLKERAQYLVQYEKLPIFCFFCGCMGHEVTECGDGMHTKESCGWGDWLRVTFPQSYGRDDRGSRGRGRGGGRGRGAGRGVAVDDGSVDMDYTTEPEDALEVDPEKVAKTISPLPLQEKKRPRKEQEGEKSDAVKNLAKSALLLEGSDRAQ